MPCLHQQQLLWRNFPKSLPLCNHVSRSLPTNLSEILNECPLAVVVNNRVSNLLTLIKKQLCLSSQTYLFQTEGTETYAREISVNKRRAISTADKIL